MCVHHVCMITCAAVRCTQSRSYISVQKHWVSHGSDSDLSVHAPPVGPMSKRARVLQAVAVRERDGQHAPVSTPEQSPSSTPAKRRRLQFAELAGTQVGTRLFKDATTGAAHVRDLQRTASCIVADYGDRGDVVSVLASLGARGEQQQNVHRDFVRWCSSSGELFLSPVDVYVTCKSTENHGTCVKPHKVLYPHEVFATAYSAGDAMFNMVFKGEEPGGLDMFWKNHEHAEWVVKHPAFAEHKLNKSVCIPIGFHADKGQHVKRDKILTIGWNSVMSRAATSYAKHLLTVIPDDVLLPGVTDEQVFAVFVRPLAAVSNVTPHGCDHPI